MKRWSLFLIVLLLLSLLPQLNTINLAKAQAPYVSIYDIQYTTDPSGDSPYKGQTVLTRGVVTAVASKGFFIQNGTGAWSGIYVYVGSAPNVNIGDLVEVEGTVDEYYGMTEITNNPTVNVIGTADVPDPVVLQTGEVAQEKWESVLIEVRNVIVTDPDLGYGEWEIDDSSGPVRVDDLMYSYTPQANQELDYVRGIVYYSYGNFKIEPRGVEDIGIPPNIPKVSIQEIQGQQSSSPYAGQVVRTYGVVTFATSYGFFIQNGTGPWSGIWVYTGSGISVNEGDYVRVQALVQEYYGLTELNYKDSPTDIREVVVLGTASVPDPVVLPTGNVSQEQWESVLVEVRYAKVVELANKYGEWKVDDGSGELIIDDKFYDYEPTYIGKRYEYIRGVLYYSYGAFKLEPRYEEDIKLYVPQIGVQELNVSGTPVRRTTTDIKLKVFNNGTLAENITILLYIDDTVLYNQTTEISPNGTLELTIQWMPLVVGKVTITAKILSEIEEVYDERSLQIEVFEHPETIAYGVVTYYQARYEYYSPQLTILYNQFKSLLEELQSYNVDLSAIQENIEEIESKMGLINERYSKYQLLKERTKGAYYSVLMVPIMKATILTKETIEELEDLIPLLNSTLEQAKAAAEQNVTIVVPTVHKVLIDSSHNQYYNHERMSSLISRIRNDLGWEVEVNTGTITLEKLQEYDILILTNPRRDITDEEANAIKEFVKQGGGLFILGDWYKYIYERSLNKVIEEFGIKFNDDELMDDEVNTGAPYFPLVGEFNFEHPATKFLDETSQLYYNGDTLDISGNAVWLIRGYETSYAVDETEKVVKETGSKPIVAAAVEVGEGRIVAYGSSKAISDSYYGKYIESNWAFVKGVLLWLAKET